jgi:hypothetical protein
MLFPTFSLPASILVTRCEIRRYQLQEQVERKKLQQAGIATPTPQRGWQ